jgi:hypothetical protein
MKLHKPGSGQQLGSNEMLNEFSDKVPEAKRKPFVMSGEFCLGVTTVLVGLTLILGFIL